jgi:RNA polymerase sigma-B factor
MSRKQLLSDKALLRRHCEDGDLVARAQLIERYMALVRSVAARYRGHRESREDLVQVGAIGLIKAIDRFDPGRGVALSTYAVPKILGEIKRHFRGTWAVRVPRSVQDLNVNLRQIVDDLTGKLGRAPTVSELALEAGVDEEHVLEALHAGGAYAFASPSRDGDRPAEERDFLETVGDDDPGYELADGLSVITPALRALGARERVILHLHFAEDMTQSEIGISQMHVSRLIRSSLERIRETVGLSDASAA